MSKRKKKFHSLSGCEKAKLSDANISDGKTNPVDCNRCLSIIEKTKNKSEKLEVVAKDGNVIPIEKCTKPQLIEFVKGAFNRVKEMDEQHKKAFAEQESFHDKLIDGKVNQIQEKHSEILKLKDSMGLKNIIIIVLIVALIGSLIF